MSDVAVDDRLSGGDPLLDRVRATLDAGDRSRLRDRGIDPASSVGSTRATDPGAADQSLSLPTNASVAPRVVVNRRSPAIPDELLQRGPASIIERDATPVAELRRPSSKRWGRVLQVGMLLFALVVGYYAVTLWQVAAAGRSDQARPVDAIVVMGAAQYDGTPSPQLAARLDHVVELWPQGYAPLVIVTGGKQPADRFTEAEASARYLIDRGVPESAIVLENEGATSFDSLQRVAALLAGGSTDSASSGSAASVLVVTDPYHTLRSRLIAEEVGLTAYGSPTGTSVVTGARSLERHVWEAGGIAIGRLTGFDWLDDATG